MEASQSPQFAERLSAFVGEEVGVSPEDMPEETEWCTSGNTIGAICLRLGTLNFDQVEATLGAQGDDLFGSTALRLGFLSERTLCTMLELQEGLRALDFGGMLILQGRLDLPELLKLLSRFFAASEAETRDAQPASEPGPEFEPELELETPAVDPNVRQLFGLYLIDRGHLSEAQLMAALERQRVERVSIGRLAYEHGLMTIDQVVDVLNLQPKKNMLYGEIAVSLGYMSVDQRDDLLRKQLDATVPLGQLLVEMNILDPELVDAELRTYHEGAPIAE